MENYKLINFCEFDKNAVKSYCVIHNVPESLNLGDITKVDETKIEPFNVIVGGSPCQDFSISGKQSGSIWDCKDCGFKYNPLTVHYSKRNECPACHSKNIRKTRSSLLVEWLRIIRTNKPNFGIYENVKNIVGKQFKNTTFRLFEKELNEYGYNTYWKVLNSKNYGVPQNRERLILVLIKKELDNGLFEFPEGFDSGLRLKDVLENNVPEKFYINNEKTKTLIKKLNKKHKIIINPINDLNCLNSKGGRNGILNIQPSINDRIYDANNISTAITTNPFFMPNYLTNYIKKIGLLDVKGNDQIRRVYDSKGIAPTLTCMQGGNTQPKIVEKPFNINNCIYDFKKIIIKQNYRVRKLMPIECFRLMGFYDKNFYAAKNVGISDSQLYKQSGNSIVTSVLYYTLKELYIAMPYLFTDIRLGSYFSGIGAFEIALNRLFHNINYGFPEDFPYNKDYLFTVNSKYPIIKVKRFANIDKEKLRIFLLNQKNKLHITNNDIAKHLELPIQCVNKWFDDIELLDIPNESVWKELKDLFGLKDTEFDNEINKIEFISYYKNPFYSYYYVNPKKSNKINTFANASTGTSQAGKIYDTDYIAPTLCAGNHGYAMGYILNCNINTNQIKIIGNYTPSKHEASRIIDTNYIAPTVKENHGTVTAIIQ